MKVISPWRLADTITAVTDSSLWLPLGTAAIGAVAALAGNALGPMFGAQGEHRQWLRNKQAEQLESFHALLDEADHDASAYSVSLSFKLAQETDLDRRNDHSKDIFKRLTSAAARAELYTSPRLAELMSRVAYDYQVVYASTDSYDKSKWDEVHRSWSADVAECTRLIRSELRVD